MTDAEFDAALIVAFFRLVGDLGWRRTSVAAAAQEASLPLARARERFPNRASVLLRFGRLADETALAGATTEGSVRDKLFDLLMSRFEAMQPHRLGIQALMRALPFEPVVAVLLACATKRSMRWMLQAAGVGATGLRGEVEVRGLLAVWLWVLRTWEKDDSPDLSSTMAALDTALARAEQAAGWLGGRRGAVSGEDATAVEATDTAKKPPPEAPLE
jgi:hypothetical protein